LNITSESCMTLSDLGIIWKGWFLLNLKAPNEGLIHSKIRE
jgi:hypothetical protein